MKLLHLLALLPLLACSPAPGPVAPVPDPPDPPPVPVDATDCEAAGIRLRDLDCRDRDGNPYWQTPEGTPFADACQDAADDGRDWNADSIRCIMTCADLEPAYWGRLPTCPK